MQRDYYNMLGLKRAATPDDIKKAYRSLAMKYHPDRNPDVNAVQRFKDIKEAYACLSDPSQRIRYDRLGPLYTPDGRPPSAEDLNQMVGNVWGNLFGRRNKKPGIDLRYTISLSLEDVAAGTHKPIVVPRMVRCGSCLGDGAHPEGGKKRCPVCKGSGRATGPRLFRTGCYHCEGRGFTVARSCETCGGEGRLSLDDHLVVKVPPGVDTGQKLKLKGKGDAPRGDGPEGDLLVIVNISDHDLFKRRGDDLLVDLPLSFAELVLGADVTVPTLEGTTTIRVPAGSEPGKILRLAHRGLPRVGRSGRGDLHLQVVLEVPEGLTEAQRDALNRWQNALPASAHPRRSAFRAALARRDA